VNMKGLILDTTIKKGYVAAFDGEREAVCYLDTALSTQSALIPACHAALNRLDMTVSDFDGVAAVVGPGSFTGIRIGVTFGNALAYARALPRFAFSSFDLMNAVRPTAPAFSIEAGHGSYYAAFREGNGLFERNADAPELPTGTVDQSEIMAELPRGALLVARRAFENRAFSVCAPTFETDLLRPNYMRKSQAERLKDEKK